MYNVGPEFRRQSQGAPVTCHACGSTALPLWDGVEGDWMCAECFEPLPDYEEGDA
jgi:hypothetical protein